jgi:type I restriction enzyme S subunit
VADFLDNLRKPVKKSERIEGIYPYYGANGQQGTINGFIFDEPLVLLAEDGGFFGVPDRKIAYQINGKAWVNNHAHVLRPKRFIDINFLARHLEHYDVTPYVSGTTRGKLTKGSASEIPILVPPLHEQRRIAAILDKADAIRRKRQRAIELTEELLRSAFLEMFGDPVTNPRGWPKRQLHEIAYIQSGVTKGRKLSSKQTVCVPYMRVANVQDGHLDLSEVKSIEVLTSDIEKYQLLPDDILLTEGGDPDKLGRGTVWRGQIEPCIHQNHIFCVRLDASLALPDYLSVLIGSDYGKYYFLKAAKQTTGIATINKTQLKAFPVLLPPIKLQKKHINIAAKVDVLQDKIREVCWSQTNLFNSLTHLAFRGELTANTADKILQQTATG